jgi:uncharacterized protein
MIKLLSGVKIVGLSLYFEKERVLAISDLHLGVEEALNNRGVLIPRTQFRQALKALTNILGRVKPRTIIILGDLKHEFEGISGQVWDEVSKLLTFLQSKAKVVVLRGNHDTMLKPIVSANNIELKDYYAVGRCFFCHGNKLCGDEALKKAELIIIGHCHPAINLRDGARVEKYKCFLVGKYKLKSLIVMPSFSFFYQGVDVLSEAMPSPFIKGTGSFKVFAAGENAYDFGSVKRLRKLML